MLQEIATVVKHDGNTTWVETAARSSCSSCSSGTCTTAVVAKLFNVKRNRVALDAVPEAKVGDQLLIGIPDSLLVRASLWLYLVPLLVMFSAVAMGIATGIGEGGQVVLALSGLLGGFLLVRGLTRRAAVVAVFQPQLLQPAALKQNEL